VSEQFNLAIVRRRKIEELVRAKGSMGNRDLSRQFGVSEATIRRDLTALDEEGAVVRIHGGALVNSRVMVDLPNEERKSVGAEEKLRIGQAAIDLLAGDEVVFLDAGTTSHAIAALTYKKPSCTYVTTSLEVANLLQANNIKQFYIIGGSYQPVNDSFTGTLAISALRSLSFDIAFLCCSAIDTERQSISVANEAYSQVQREVIPNTRRRYVMADTSKFKPNAFMQTARFDQISGIITNREVEDEITLQLKNAGLDLVLV
jgi:DeoR family transcriptional regulator of aga operon